MSFTRVAWALVAVLLTAVLALAGNRLAAGTHTFSQTTPTTTSYQGTVSEDQQTLTVDGEADPYVWVNPPGVYRNDDDPDPDYEYNCTGSPQGGTYTYGPTGGGATAGGTYAKNP